MKNPLKIPVQFPNVISKESYNKILTTAKELFSEFGSHEVRVDSICRKAQISRVTFYKEFKNKNHLVFVFMLEEEKEFETSMREMMRKKKKYPAILKEFFSMLDERRKEISCISYESMNKPEVIRLFKLYYRQMESNWRFDLFDLGIREGYIREGIDKNFTSLLLENLTNFYFDLLKQNLYPMHELDKMVIEAFFYGVSQYKE